MINSRKKPTIDYKVTVETGDEEDAGTNGKVYITLVGMDDQSRRILLDHEGKPEFQRGQTDTFNITIGVIEDVHVIGVELDSSAESDNPDNWLLKAVSLEDLTQKSAQSFPYDNWLTPTEENSTASVEIELSNPITEYEVIVKTGNKKDAGTLGQVYITIYGEKGHSRKIHLNHGGDSDFQKGQIDKFYIRTTKDIGHANKIRIELDSTEESQSDNWFLERVSVTDIRLDKKYRFPWKKWLTPTADQKTISVEIPLSPKLI